MPFRRSRSAVPEAPDPVVAARLARVVGPESGIFRLVPDPFGAGEVRFAGEVPLPEDRHGASPGLNALPDEPSAEPVLPAAGRALPFAADPASAPATGGALPSAVARRRALAAFDPGRRAVRALGVLALVVAVVVGFVVWRARPRAEPVVAGPEAATVAPGPVSSPASVLVVSVVGKVNRPGLVRLPGGARVADAIEAAGGLQPGADIGYLNLARKVADGELIAVGVSPPPAPAGGAVGGAPGAGGGPVNLNTATVAELDTLPGVGPVLAQRIVDHRTRTGGFKSVEELRKVDGVGDSRFEQIKDLVTV